MWLRMLLAPAWPAAHDTQYAAWSCQLCACKSHDCCALQAAALHLAYAEYDDMSTMERMAILRGLCGLLLATDAAREVVGARLEAIAALQPKPKVQMCSLSCLAPIEPQIRQSSVAVGPRVFDSAAGCCRCCVQCFL